MAQTETGIWEVVDGLQRLSTIFELQGELREKDGSIRTPLIMEATKYLPSLEGKVWQAKELADCLSEAQRLDVKRTKLDIKIIKRESSSQVKFDLLQRLNSYGSQLNVQEMRSALMVAASPEFFAHLERLASMDEFRSTVRLSDKQIEERYDLELVTRFIVLHDWPAVRLTLANLRDLPQVLDDETVQLANVYPKDFDKLDSIFRETFTAISENGEENVFRRWDQTRNDFRGGFVTSAFEIFALGVGYHVAHKKRYRSDLLSAVKELWSSPRMQSGYATGRSTESRLAEFIPLGRDITRA